MSNLTADQLCDALLYGPPPAHVRGEAHIQKHFYLGGEETPTIFGWWNLILLKTIYDPPNTLKPDLKHANEYGRGILPETERAFRFELHRRSRHSEDYICFIARVWLQWRTETQSVRILWLTSNRATSGAESKGAEIERGYSDFDVCEAIDGAQYRPHDANVHTFGRYIFDKYFPTMKGQWIADAYHPFQDIDGESQVRYVSWELHRHAFETWV